MIYPHELIVTNEPGEPVSIKLDPENTIGGPMYFVIDSGGEELYLTLDALRELVTAAEMLKKTTRSYQEKEAGI